MHAPRITKATLIALVPVMAFSLGACSVDVSTPGTVTQPPTNLHTLSLEDQILDDTWNSQPADNREAMCDVYAVDPQSMWRAFNEGAHDAFTKDQFDAMIHVDVTHALEPLEPTSVWVVGENPETYPSGL